MPHHRPSCVGCGYSLAGLSAGACPECGRPFDPTIPNSIEPDTRLIETLASSSPNWPIWGGLAGLLCLVLAFASSPNGSSSDDWSMVFVILMWIVMVPYAAWFVVHVMARMWLGLKERKVPPWRLRWIAVPVIVAAFYTFIYVGAVFWVRWHFAEPGFAAVARSGVPPKSRTRIGSFRIDRVWVKPDGTWVCELAAPDCYSDGPATLEHGPSAGQHSPCSTALSNGWWISWDPT